MINVEENLREICRRKGLRLSDVAERMGSGQSNLISRVRGNPSVAKLEEIANALNVSVSELLTMRPDSSQGLVIIGGETYAISKPPLATVQIPIYTRYDILRGTLMMFIAQAIEKDEDVTKMGIVETMEMFSLVFDHYNQQFILSLCYADGRTLTYTYDKLEFCDWNGGKTGEEAEWNVQAVTTEILNDVQEAVPSKLQSK